MPLEDGFYASHGIEMCVVGNEAGMQQPEPPEAALSPSDDTYMATTSQPWPETGSKHVAPRFKHGEPFWWTDHKKSRASSRG